MNRMNRQRKTVSYLSHHINSTGPGDYNLPTFISSKNVPTSIHKNTPAFSLGAKVTKKKPYFP